MVRLVQFRCRSELGQVEQAAALSCAVAVLQALAGAGAGVVTKTAMSPLERMKVLFQMQGLYGTRFGSVAEAARFVHAQEGLPTSAVYLPAVQAAQALQPPTSGRPVSSAYLATGQSRHAA